MAKYSAEGLEEVVGEEVTVILRSGEESGLLWSITGELERYHERFEIDNGSSFVSFTNKNVVKWYVDCYLGTEFEDKIFITVKV